MLQVPDWYGREANPREIRKGGQGKEQGKLVGGTLTACLTKQVIRDLWQRAANDMTRMHEYSNRNKTCTRAHSCMHTNLFLVLLGVNFSYKLNYSGTPLQRPS